VTGIGFLSITRVVELLKRIAKIGKPTRIYYITDFDPAGDFMPQSVARMVEYYREKFAPDVEIKLEHILLTKEQCLHYKLPRIPIKDKDLRKAGFERRYGVGATELDALEALHPGEMERQIREAVEPYWDDNIKEYLQDTENDAQDAVEADWDEAVEPYRNDLERLQEEACRVAETYRDEADALQKKVDEAMAPILLQLNAVRHAITELARQFDPPLPSRPESDLEPPDEDDILFDSSRDYLDQLKTYKERKQDGDDTEDKDDEDGD
jgi:hypothetical protein